MSNTTTIEKMSTCLHAALTNTMKRRNFNFMTGVYEMFDMTGQPLGWNIDSIKVWANFVSLDLMDIRKYVIDKGYSTNDWSPECLALMRELQGNLGYAYDRSDKFLQEFDPTTITLDNRHDYMRVVEMCSAIRQLCEMSTTLIIAILKG